MLKGKWIAIVALGIALAVSPLSEARQVAESPQEADQAESGEQSAPPQVLSLPNPVPVQIIVEDGEAEARRSAEQRAEQREADDLQAQEGMRSASWWMVSVAAAQTIFVIIGTGVIVFTLHLTRQATRAAVDAVDVTREMGQKQLRPWVCCEGFAAQPFANCTVVHNGQTFTEGINFVLTWKNRGLSPAIGCEISHHVQVVPTGEMAPEPDWGEAPRGDVIGPDGDRFGGSAIVGDDYTAVRLGQCDVIVNGRIRYNDALGDASCERVSETRYRLTVNGQTQNADGTSAPSWYSRSEGPQKAT